MSSISLPFAMAASAAFATVLMVALWARQLVTKNATAVDVAWSFLVPFFALVYAVFVDGEPARRVLVAALAGAWGLRLGSYILFDRVLRGHGEDGRYRALREHWGARAPLGFFFVFIGQVLVAWLFSLPLLAAMRGGALDGWALAGVVVWVVAVVGETVADRQLAAFRAESTNRGEVCQQGLWRFSRHPNYFFEWLHWFAYVLIGHGAWLTWLGPVVMLVFLYRFTGIPYTELQAEKSRGEKYRRYQRTTSAFFPWPPRREGATL